MAAAIPFVRSWWPDANGKPLAGGKLWTYQAGTNTPIASYTDSTGLVPNPNPVILDAAGRAKVYLAPGSYKIVLMNKNDVVQWTEDNVKPADGGGGGIVDSDYVFNEFSPTFLRQFTTTGLMDTLDKILGGSWTQESDNTTSGEDAIVGEFGALLHRLVSDELFSVAGIEAPSTVRFGILKNSTSINQTIKNNHGPAGVNGILTGTDEDLILKPGAAIWVIYDTTSQRWQVVGGSGNGGSGSGILIVQDYGEMLAIPTEERYEGLLIYVVDEQENWQLRGGTDDTSWENIDELPKTVVSTTQTLTNGGTISKGFGRIERVKVEGSGGETTVTLSTIGAQDGDQMFVQGMSDENPVIVGPFYLTAGLIGHFMYDAETTTWIKVGGV